MVKVIDQDIPSEMTDEYDHSLHRIASWQKEGSFARFGHFLFGEHAKLGAGAVGQILYVRRRVPFRLPHMQSRSFQTPSESQLQVRHAFSMCIDCFNIQPYTGGATPPDPGPRDRAWWYIQSLGSGLFYMNYFVQQSWPIFRDQEIPDWCRVFMEGEWSSPWRRWGGLHGGYTSCSVAWEKSLEDYFSRDPEPGVLDGKFCCYATWYRHAVSNELYTDIKNMRQDFTVDLSEENIKASIGRPWQKVKFWGFYMNIEIEGLPGNRLMEWSVPREFDVPSSSGWYYFVWPSMWPLGDGVYTFVFGGTDWPYALQQPVCPPNPGDKRTKGFIVHDVKLWFI